MSEKLVKISLKAKLSKEIELELQVTPVLLPNGEIDEQATIAKAEKIATNYGNRHKWDAIDGADNVLTFDYEDEEDGINEDEGVYTYFDTDAQQDELDPEYDNEYALRNSNFNPK